MQAIRRFENRTIAVSRIWRALEQPATGTHVHAGRSNGAARSRAPVREHSKACQVFRLLQRTEGATVADIQALTGWQAHTVRGFISRNSQKRGWRVRSFKRNGERVYRARN